MFDFGNGKHTEVMPIWRFLDWKKPTWAISPKFTSVVFREMGQLDCYKYLFVGKRCPLAFSLQREVMPDKYKYIPDIGDVMGELMDLSIRFNLYKVFVKRSFHNIEYTVWLNRIEDEQDCNIDADMVEKFCEKVFGK